MVEVKSGTVADQKFFPFALSDLKYWVIRRKDGTLIKYTLTSGSNGDLVKVPGQSEAKVGTYPREYKPTHHSLSDWCMHNPSEAPIFSSDEFNIDLYIADAFGTKAHHEEFDFVLDCGNVLTITANGNVVGCDNKVLYGDPELVKFLAKHGVKGGKTPTRVMKIDWFDRQAPPLEPSFWPALAEKLDGMVLCNCQGGHGRSGTSLVCLMMVMNPEYTPKDAIIHLRAMHCPRAIESKVQHEYINAVGKYLGRPENAGEVTGIQDYRAAFLALTLPSAASYQTQLAAQKEKK